MKQIKEYETDCKIIGGVDVRMIIKMEVENV